VSTAIGRSEPIGGGLDNGPVDEAAATPLPRRGRAWVIAALGLTVLALGYAIVEIATKEPGREVVRVEGIGTAQETFGGVPQAGDRAGSDNAPVTIQYFADMQCGSCRENFLATIPSLVTDYARPGDVKILMRHYSVAQNPLELGFYGSEAAAAQGYGWQYTYLFFRNQAEAEQFGVGDEFLASLAGSIGELDVPLWEEDLERELASDSPVSQRLESYDELGTDLGIRTRPAAIVTGPEGTRTLQDGPSLQRLEKAIEAVGG
jgi:protein-disulfide isomerase